MNKILTYPRSGAHYLQQMILESSSTYIELEHAPFIFDDTFTITIARDPFDSIHSLITMKKHYYPDSYLHVDYIKHYIDSYKELIEHADLVIDYNKLIKFPWKTTKAVCKILGLKEREMRYNQLPDDKDLGYLVTSTSVKEYQDKHITKEDVEKCYPLYRELLNKSIRLT